jgi:hypothetical protein
MSLANLTRFERFFDRNTVGFFLVLVLGLGLGAAFATAVLGV